MNITLSFDTELVKKLRKIAAERDTTLTGMVRDYLERVAAEEAGREREKLEQSFAKFQFKIGKRTWKRQGLHDRP